jgi:catechol 2,3-dioxygenase-like lactoylglutathione lyase family enzyme
VTLVTLGVADLAAARAFYARLGWREHGAQPGVAFYQMNARKVKFASTRGNLANKAELSSCTAQKQVSTL